MKPFLRLPAFFTTRFYLFKAALRLPFLCIALVCLAGFFFAGCTRENGISSTENTQPAQTSVHSLFSDPIADLIGSMSLEEKICQLFIVSIDGTEARTSAIVYDIPPGGYILFNRNFTGTAEQIIKLTGDVQTFYADLRSDSNRTSVHCAYENTAAVPRRIPPFFAIDHEGGEVNRLRGIASPLPSAQSVARFLKPEEAEKLYGYAAEQISALGIHVNFAPLAETLGSHNKNFLSLRSFGSLEQTKTYGAAFIRSFTENRVFCVLKHFPGNTNDDPHTVLPVLSGTAVDIENLYFAPFSFLLSSVPSSFDSGSAFFPDGLTTLQEGSPVVQSLLGFPRAGVLMSHVRVEAFDEKNPACFSPALIRDILQNKLNFDGLIFSDDLYMGALASSSDFSPAESAEKALRAGVHVFMLSRSVYRDFIPDLAAKALSDPDFSTLIDEALAKILRAKFYMGLIKLSLNVNAGGSAAAGEPKLCSVSLTAEALDKLYNFENQMRHFNAAKQKGEALYYAYWAK